MLRRNPQFEIFAAVFSEAGRSGAGGIERDACVLATRRGGDTFRRQEATCGALSARRGGWVEYCGAFGEPNYYRMRPTIAIPQPKSGSTDAAVDLDGFFGLHPSLAPLEPLFHKKPISDCACSGFAGPDALAFRRAGFHGVRNAGI